tara:strand:+ start:87182 stop:87529 length:348 start_codon:yes stop_codon:yes gene_type:complete
MKPAAKPASSAACRMGISPSVGRNTAPIMINTPRSWRTCRMPSGCRFTTISHSKILKLIMEKHFHPLQSIRTMKTYSLYWFAQKNSHRSQTGSITYWLDFLLTYVGQPSVIMRHF